MWRKCSAIQVATSQTRLLRVSAAQSARKLKKAGARDITGTLSNNCHGEAMFLHVRLARLLLLCSKSYGGLMIRRRLRRAYWRLIWHLAMFALRELYSA